MSYKEKLLGNVGKIKAIGNIEASPIKIIRKFENKETVIYYHCRGCGTDFELNRKQADGLARMNSILLPKEIPLGMYFEADGCEVCDGENNVVSLRISPRN